MSTAVHVDHDLCAGTGSCARIYPEVFEFGADLKSHVRDDATRGALDEQRLADAMQACPWAAISRLTNEQASS